MSLESPSPWSLDQAWVQAGPPLITGQLLLLPGTPSSFCLPGPLSAWSLLPPSQALPSYPPSPEDPLPHTSSIRGGHSLPGGLSRPGVSVASSLLVTAALSVLSLGSDRVTVST